MKERTMTFSINGDFITRLAREKCHYEGKMEYAMNLLESCLESDEITDNERKGLAFAILDGRAEVTGTYPGDDYRFHYLDQRDERWNIARTLEKLHEKAEQAEKELHQVEEKLGFVASGYMSSWDRREAQKQYREETGEKLFANMEEERESTENFFAPYYGYDYLWNCNWSNQHNFSQTSSRISWSKRRDAGRMYYIWKNYSRSIAIPYVTVRIFKPGCYRRKAETGIDCDSYCRCDKYGW